MKKRLVLRDSGVELLRILTAFAVILLHYNDGRAFKYAADGSLHQMVLYFLESCSICAVDLFVLISGYYLSRTQRRSILKPIELFVELFVIRLLFFCGPLLIGHGTFSLKELLSCFIPNSYFLVLYCSLYLISPYFNRVFQKLNSKQWKHFLILALLLFSVWNTAADVFEEIIGAEKMGLSTVTAWGSKQGFNFVNFCLLYSIGAYLQYNPIPQILEKRKVLLSLWLAVVICIFIWALICRRFNLLELRSAWVYHNPLVIFSAALLFLFFRSFTFKNKVINRFSAAAFTCYLVHGKLLGYVNVRKAVSSSVFIMLAHIALVMIGLYLVSWIIHEVYHFTTDWLFQILKKYKPFQSEVIAKEED